MLPQTLTSDNFYQVATVLARASYAAYVVGDEAIARLQGPLARLPPRLEAHFFEDRFTDSEVFLFWFRGAIVVAFRGTSEECDWFTNFDLWPAKYQGGRLHNGFLKAWLSLQDRVEAQVNEWRNRDASAQIWVTGHSLGGAIATVAVALSPVLRRPAGVMTFGQPRALCARHSRRVKRRLKSRFYRVTGQGDMVPRLPAPILFSHVGEEVYISRAGKLRHRFHWTHYFRDLLLGVWHSLLNDGFDTTRDHSINEAYIFYVVNLASHGIPYPPCRHRHQAPALSRSRLP